MEYLQLTMDEFLQEEQGIKEELGSMAKSFVRTGWRLSRIDRSGAYKLKGFKSIAEYARATFGMTSDGVSRFIDVYERYSVPGDTPELKEQYKDFNFSQLKEMLTIPEEDTVMIRPETKREDIRELKRFNRENENNPDALLNWQQEPEGNLKKAVLEFFRNRKDSLNALYGSEAYQRNGIKEMSHIIRHGQKKTFRDTHTGIFMILYEDQIFVKGFSKDAEDITWEKFFETVRGLFDGSAAGAQTWENYFRPEKTETEEEPEIAPAQEEDGGIPGQDSILDHPEYMPEPVPCQDKRPGTVPVGEQYKAIYESLTPTALAPLNTGETGFLAAMLYKNFAGSAVSSGKLNYRATDEGMIFNPDGERTLVRWTALAERLIRTFGKKKQVKMVSVAEEDGQPQNEKWTEAGAVRRYAEKYPNELKKIMKICRQFQNNGDRAKAVQKNFAPYGWNGSSSLEFGRTFKSFSEGVEIESDAEKQKVEMKYGRFVVELLNLYDPYSPEFMEPEEIAPAQQEGEAAEGQQGTKEPQETCGKPEGWPDDLADIPVPSLEEATGVLWDAERDLKDYLSCEGIPQKTILKMQLTAGGLRLIRNLVEDILSGEDD